MSSPLDRLCQGSDELLHTHIDGFGDLYGRRFTIARQRQVRRWLDVDSDDPGALAEIVVRLALDEGGSRLFQREDVARISKEAPLHVLNDMIAFLIGDERRSPGWHQGNLNGEQAETKDDSTC